ncbi:MAG: phospholipase [Gammaproteobacteria bacterium]|nr:MAG: phospholipase [Gammaproteobacteria bacterium]
MRRLAAILTTLLIGYLLVSALVRALVPPPSSVGFEGLWHPLVDAEFLADDSAIDATGQRRVDQEIFDRLFAMIAAARELVVLDLFLFNDWQGPVPETHRALSAELVEALRAAREREPDLAVVFVTDPINEVYGGMHSTLIAALEAAGVSVVRTCLDTLQDSNPAWSGLYRLAIAPFGNAPGSLLPNPFGAGRVSLRSYFALLNFKANHRKLVIADDGKGDLVALVTSANPHDGSSAHRNVALGFAGDAVEELLANEATLLDSCGAAEALARLDGFLDPTVQRAPTGVPPSPDDAGQAAGIRVLGESAIQRAMLERIDALAAGDRLDMAMFYLADRDIVEALVAARRRGAEMRLLLDINADAFGREKNGVPNRPVAAELAAAGIEVRWCATQGEQCHAKWLMTRQGDRADAFIGSANLTRRNLDDFNLELDVQVRAATSAALVGEMLAWFERQWQNGDGRQRSLDYAARADESPWLEMQYRFMEATGLSTF